MHSVECADRTLKATTCACLLFITADVSKVRKRKIDLVARDANSGKVLFSLVPDVKNKGKNIPQYMENQTCGKLARATGLETQVDQVITRDMTITCIPAKKKQTHATKRIWRVSAALTKRCDQLLAPVIGVEHAIKQTEGVGQCLYQLYNMPHDHASCVVQYISSAFVHERLCAFALG